VTAAAVSQIRPLLAEKKSKIIDKTYQLHVISTMVDSRLEDKLLPIADLLAHPVQLAEPLKRLASLVVAHSESNHLRFTN